MQPPVIYGLAALLAYLMGSIPFGYLAAKVRGIDIRKAGSGNIGATNALRVLGRPAGIAVLVLDVFKGFAAVAFLPAWLLAYCQPGAPVVDLGLCAGIFAVLGHNYPVWLKFKGGKGIATTAGVYVALAPWAVLCALLVFILVVAITKYASVGSIAAAVVLPAAVWILFPHNLALGLATTALGVLAIYKHRSNLQRLRAGTEPKLGQKAVSNK